MLILIVLSYYKPLPFTELLLFFVRVVCWKVKKSILRHFLLHRDYKIFVTCKQKTRKPLLAAGLKDSSGSLCKTMWCRRPESNRHGSPHTPLKRARLPIPPLRHTYFILSLLWLFLHRLLTFTWFFHDLVFLGQWLSYLRCFCRPAHANITHNGRTTFLG